MVVVVILVTSIGLLLRYSLLDQLLVSHSRHEKTTLVAK